MNNPIIETDLAEILREIRDEQKDIKSDQRQILDRINNLKVGQVQIEGKINSVDEKLSGQINSVDEKLSGQIKSLDTKVEQLDKRIGNSELTNRGILVGLIVVILGGAAKLFGLMGN